MADNETPVEFEEEVAEGNRRLRFKAHGETYEVDIPDSWKVTFGYFNPGGSGGYHDKSTALRIYEAQDRQRMCFLGVSEFRDLSIPIRKLQRTAKTKSSSERSRNKRKELYDETIDENWETEF